MCDSAAYQTGHLAKAANLAMDRIPAWSKRLNKDAPVLVYCYHGNSSQEYAQMLADFRFNRVYSGLTALPRCWTPAQRWHEHPRRRRRLGCCRPLSASDVDCATTVMLKILDGKCKMAEQEKHIMAWLYRRLVCRPWPALCPGQTR